MFLRAKENLFFLAAAFELKEYYKNPEKFISSFPIFLEATCSGLQHLASMVNAINLAKYVNLLTSSKEELPLDVYRRFARGEIKFCVA